MVNELRLSDGDSGCRIAAIIGIGTESKSSHHDATSIIILGFQVSI